MARQLPADDRLRRLRRLGWTVIVLGALALVATAGAFIHVPWVPQARYVVRPELSVHGVTAGSVVRLNGVPVGRVAKVGLWSDPATGRARPEVVLALDAARDASLRDLRRRAADGLRVRFVSVNPASGLLEVEIAWAPGSMAFTATADADELPWQPSPQEQALASLLPAIQRLAAGDLRTRVDQLAQSLSSAEARLADAPTVAASAARNAGRLRAAVGRIEQADLAARSGSLQGRLGELREGLRVAGDALDALDRDLAAWPGAAGPALREFSADCCSVVERAREQLPAAAGP